LYDGDNKEIIKKAFYDSLTKGTDVGEAQIEQMAMALLDRYMAKSWVATDCTTTAIFNWLLVTLGDCARVPSNFSPSSPLVLFNQALQWLVQDCNTSGINSHAATLPSEALLVMDSLSRRSRGSFFTEDNSTRLADANNLYKIIDKFMDTERKRRAAPSQIWRQPWQRLVLLRSAQDFWHGLRSLTFSLDSLHGLYTTSDDSFSRCRAMVYLLLKSQHNATTVAAFIEYLRGFDSVLADLQVPMEGSWIDLQASELRGSNAR
jgi:hypothetical protein